MELVGESPMHYLRQRRFDLATIWLKQSDQSIAEIGYQLGYESESSFNRAYKKFMGMTPGAVRRSK